MELAEISVTPVAGGAIIQWRIDESVFYWAGFGWTADRLHAYTFVWQTAAERMVDFCLSHLQSKPILSHGSHRYALAERPGGLSAVSEAIAAARGEAPACHSAGADYERSGIART